MNERRAVLRIQLNPSAKQHLDRLSALRGMTQISIMSRLLEWFVRQNEIVQLSVLGVISPELAKPLVRELLEQIGEQDSRNVEDRYAALLRR